MRNEKNFTDPYLVSIKYKGNGLKQQFCKINDYNNLEQKIFGNWKPSKPGCFLKN